VKLYHFTWSGHWPEINVSGVLKVTESNASLKRVHAGQPVVWLTDDPNPSVQRWGLPNEVTMTVGQFYAVHGVSVVPGEEPEAIIALERSRKVPQQVIEDFKASGQTTLKAADKTEIRLTVEIPDAEAQRYSSWRRKHGVRNAVYRDLAATGGDPERWWVVERPIPSSEWIEAIDTATGDRLPTIHWRTGGGDPR